MGKRLVTDFFRHDHDRLEQLFEEFCEARATGSQPAGDCFRQLQRAMERHLDWEDRLMFPLYESRAGPAGQLPIAAMRAEHEELHKLLATLQRLLAGPDSAVEPILPQLRCGMEMHHAREEAIVYGLIDDDLNDADRAQLFARLDAWPAAGR